MNTTNTLDMLASAGVPSLPQAKRLTAYAVLSTAHAETPVIGGLSARAAWDTLAAFAERIGAPMPVSYRDTVLNAAAIAGVKQKGGTRTGRVSLADAWKGALEHAERDGRDDDMRAARKAFNRIAALHSAFGTVAE